MRMPFGKWRDHELADVPSDYLRWLLDADIIRTDDLLEAVEEELQGRSARRKRAQYSHGYTAPPPPPPPPPPPVGKVQLYVSRDMLQLLAELVESGFRQLALKRHPDHGGTNDAMRELSELRDSLRAQLTR